MRFSALTGALALFSTLTWATTDASSPTAQVPLLTDATATSLVRNHPPAAFNGSCEIMHLSAVTDKISVHTVLLKLPFANKDDVRRQGNLGRTESGVSSAMWDNLAGQGYRVVKMSTDKGWDMLDEVQTWAMSEEEVVRCKTLKYTTKVINLSSRLSFTKPSFPDDLDPLVTFMVAFCLLALAVFEVLDINEVEAKRGKDVEGNREDSMGGAASLGPWEEATPSTAQTSEGRDEKDPSDLV